MGKPKFKKDRIRKVKRVTDNGFEVMKSYERSKRWIWLKRIILSHGYKIGAEIGVHRGVTTKYLLANIPDLTLIAVDLWAVPPIGSGQYKDWNFVSARNTFTKMSKRFPKRIIVLKGISWEMAKKVDDNSLDFIFIDADHSYESVVNDIKAWTPKVREGGLISGHDTHFPEVKKAIDEYIPTWKEANADHCWYAWKEEVLL